MNMLKGKRKYLLLIPIIFLIFNAFYFRYMISEINTILLREKVIEISDAVNMLAAAVEADENRSPIEHEQNIKDSVEFLDKLYQIYAGAYRQEDNEFILITDRYYETSIFEPFDYPEFIRTVNSQENGNVVIGYTPKNQKYRELHLYFRWMPHYASPDERYLVAAGVSEHSVVTKIPTILSMGQWVNTAITLALNIWMIEVIACFGFSPTATKKGGKKDVKY